MIFPMADERKLNGPPSINKEYYYDYYYYYKWCNLFYKLALQGFSFYSDFNIALSQIKKKVCAMRANCKLVKFN